VIQVPPIFLTVAQEQTSFREAGATTFYMVESVWIGSPGLEAMIFWMAGLTMMSCRVG
jgi:hypothetical protein